MDTPTNDIRFFVLILGARTPPPRIEAPVMNIPLTISSAYTFGEIQEIAELG